jgi:hypothetical protein
MGAPIQWQDKREVFGFPAYEAEVNGHRMTVWQAEVGVWGAQVTIGTREAEVACRNNGHKAKAAAVAWALEHEAGKVRLELTRRFGAIAWRVAEEVAA